MHNSKPRPPHLKSGKLILSTSRKRKAEPLRDSPEFLVRLVGPRQAKALAAENTSIKHRRD
jgi:hypothetical protein